VICQLTDQYAAYRSIFATTSN